MRDFDHGDPAPSHLLSYPFGSPSEAHSEYNSYRHPTAGGSLERIEAFLLFLPHWFVAYYILWSRDCQHIFIIPCYYVPKSEANGQKKKARKSKLFLESTGFEKAVFLSL